MVAPPPQPSPQQLVKRWEQELVSFLTTCKGGICHRSLQGQIVNLMGKPIPLPEMRLNSWEEFLLACRDSIMVGVARANPFNGKKFIFLNENAVPEEVAHIYRLTRGQEKGKARKGIDGTPKEPSMNQVIFKDAAILMQGRPSYQQTYDPSPAPVIRRRGGSNTSRFTPRSNSTSAFRSMGPRSANRPYPLMGNLQPRRPMSNGYSGNSSGSQDFRSGSASNSNNISASSAPSYGRQQPRSSYSSSSATSNGRPPQRLSFIPSGLENEDDDCVGDDDDGGFDISSGGANFVVKPTNEDEWATVAAAAVNVEPQQDKENVQPINHRLRNDDCMASMAAAAVNVESYQDKENVQPISHSLRNVDCVDNVQPARATNNISNFDGVNNCKIFAAAIKDIRNELNPPAGKNISTNSSLHNSQDKEKTQPIIYPSFDCLNSWKNVLEGKGSEEKLSKLSDPIITGSGTTSSNYVHPPAYSMGPCPKITPTPGQVWHVVLIGESRSPENKFSIVRRLVEHVKIKPMEEAMTEFYSSKDGLNGYIAKENITRGYYAIFWSKEKKWVRGQLFEDPQPGSKIVSAFAVDHGVYVKVDIPNGNMGYLKKEYTKTPHSAYYARLIDDTGTEINHDEAMKDEGILCTLYATESHQPTETTILYGLH